MPTLVLRGHQATSWREEGWNRKRATLPAVLSENRPGSACSFRRKWNLFCWTTRGDTCHRSHQTAGTETRFGRGCCRVEKSTEGAETGARGAALTGEGEAVLGRKVDPRQGPQGKPDPCTKEPEALVTSGPEAARVRKTWQRPERSNPPRNEREEGKNFALFPQEGAEARVGGERGKCGGGLNYPF